MLPGLPTQPHPLKHRDIKPRTAGLAPHGRTQQKKSWQIKEAKLRTSDCAKTATRTAYSHIYLLIQELKDTYIELALFI